MSTNKVGAPYSQARYKNAKYLCADCLEHSVRVFGVEPLNWLEQAKKLGAILRKSGLPVVTEATCDCCERTGRETIVLSR